MEAKSEKKKGVRRWIFPHPPLEVFRGFSSTLTKLSEWKIISEIGMHSIHASHILETTRVLNVTVSFQNYASPAQTLVTLLYSIAPLRGTSSPALLSTSPGSSKTSALSTSQKKSSKTLGKSMTSFFTSRFAKKVELLIDSELYFALPWTPKVYSPDLKDNAADIVVLKRYGTLLLRMLQPAPYGLEIKDRTLKLKKYENCFVGSEFVDWIISHPISTQPASREEAKQIGEEMMRGKIFAHVMDPRKGFVDGKYFYRFLIGENTISGDVFRFGLQVENGEEKLRNEKKNKQWNLGDIYVIEEQKPKPIEEKEEEEEEGEEGCSRGVVTVAKAEEEEKAFGWLSALPKHSTEITQEPPEQVHSHSYAELPSCGHTTTLQTSTKN